MEEVSMGASNTWIRNAASQGSMVGGKRRVRRVLIVDDHPIVRQGLRRVMENEEDLTVCGEAETARDARAAIKELNPDVVIADISLKQGDGIELVRDVRAHHPQLPILVLSMHDETIYAERMLSAGANGYIMKQAASEQFLISLRRVLDGGIYVSEAVGNNMIQKFAAGGSYISANPIDRLSNRELQILHMIGKYARDRALAQFEHQDGGVPSAAHQAQAQLEYRHAARSVRRELVYRPGRGAHACGDRSAAAGRGATRRLKARRAAGRTRRRGSVVSPVLECDHQMPRAVVQEGDGAHAQRPNPRARRLARIQPELDRGLTVRGA
jgi:DNA-binding NarL/FixJ family response regulator